MTSVLFLLKAKTGKTSPLLTSSAQGKQQTAVAALERLFAFVPAEPGVMPSPISKPSPELEFLASETFSAEEEKEKEKEKEKSNG